MSRASTDSRHPAVIAAIAASTMSHSPVRAAPPIAPERARAVPPSSRSGRADEQAGQLVGLAQHRVVPGVQLGPGGLESFGRTALVGLRGIASALAPDDGGLPRL